MFLVTLRFGANKASAPKFMDAHNAWLKRGFDDGVFLLAGSLKPAGGGGIFAAGIARTDLESRIAEDPFVAEKVVVPEFVEIEPGRVDPRLAFLKA
jgi:uncharacterized protein YciI